MPLDVNQVHVVRARLASAKVLSARQSSLAPVEVTCLFEGSKAILDRRAMRPARGDIENRLRAHARDRRAADVFESQRHVPTMSADALFFGGEEAGPSPVVLGESDDARFKAEGIRHR
jgi:hypothetical protein